MTVDDKVFEALTNLAKLAIEKGGRYFALSCFSELLLVDEACALAYLARGVGNDREIRLMVRNLFARFQGGGKKLDEVVTTLRNSLQPPSSNKVVAETIHDRECSMVGYFSSVSSKKITWKPEGAAASGWVLKKARDMLKPWYSNLTDRRASLARQKVLSIDISLVDKLKHKLQEETHALYVLRASDSGGASAQTSRCMAIALAACSSFVLARGTFDAVFEIENEDDLDRIKKLVNSPDWSPVHNILVWAHLQHVADGLSDAEKELTESWTDTMSKEIMNLMVHLNNQNARLILTSDDSVKWGRSKALQDLAENIYN
jgi:hypothetical protein